MFSQVRDGRMEGWDSASGCNGLQNSSCGRRHAPGLSALMGIVGGAGVTGDRWERQTSMFVSEEQMGPELWRLWEWSLLSIQGSSCQVSLLCGH